MNIILENEEMKFTMNAIVNEQHENSDSFGVRDDSPLADSQKKKKRKNTVLEPFEDLEKRSEVWKHFAIIFDKKGKRRGKCKYCGKDYAADPTTNDISRLKNHLKSCKKNPEKQSDNYIINSFTQSVDLRDMSSHISAPSKFDQEATREALARMIIIDELPFKFVEDEGFRQFISITCPQFVVPSRTTIARDCLKLYFNEKSNIKEYFKKFGTRVSLTTDTWTSNQKISYMCLTAHFIDENWKLHKLILNFVPCPCHKGEDVGLLIEKCLLDWGIDSIFTINVNNASSNETTVAYLRKRFLAWKKSICDGKYLHIRCIAHVVNLIVEDVLTNAGVLVERVRTVVRYLRQSPARWKKFKDYAVEEKVGSKKLLSLDCPTRWNSSYFMLESALLFQSVFDRYEICEKELRDDFGPQGPYGKVGLPTNDDWFMIERLVEVLKHFYEMALRISGSKFVTSNVFLDEFSDIDFLIKQWEAGDGHELSQVAKRMKAKFDEYWGDPIKMNMLLFVVVVLDPRYKLKYVFFILNQIYGDQLGKDICDRVSKALQEIFEEYQKLYCPPKPCSKTKSEFPQSSVGSFDFGLDSDLLSVRAFRLAEYRKICIAEEGDLENQSELDTYLLEKKEKVVPDFDVLGWWKINGPRFPILATLARDLFAMPISSVASESTFSTSSRMIDDFRASLNPKMSQALICAQNWIHNEPPKRPVDEDYCQIEKLDEEVVSSVGVDSVVIGL